MQKTPFSSYFLARRESGVVEETDTEITLSYVFRHFLRLRQIRGRLRKIRGRLRQIRGRLRKIRGRLRKTRGRLRRTRGRERKI